MRDSLRSFFAFAAFLLASLWLATPATAWKVHATAHFGSEVAVDQHHHHDASGSPVDDGDAPSDENGPGHNHMLSGPASLSATVDDDLLLQPPTLVTAPPVGGIAATMHEVRRPPPQEPPRFS